MPQRASGALGDLLLNVLAAAPECKSNQKRNFEPRVKNTFLQFGTGNEDLRRIRTAPPKVADAAEGEEPSSAEPSDGEASEPGELPRILTASTTESPAAEAHGFAEAAPPYGSGKLTGGAASADAAQEGCPAGFALAWDVWAPPALSVPGAFEAESWTPQELWTDAAWSAWMAWQLWPAPPGPAAAPWCAPEIVEQQHPRTERFSWVANAKKLEGKHTRLTKAGVLSIGSFAFSIFPYRVSQKRGGSCFQAADGQGTVQVKCNSAIKGDVLVSVSMSSRASCCRVMHNFSSDSICKVPGTWNFGDAVDGHTGEFSVTFEFTLMECQALIQ